MSVGTGLYDRLRDPRYTGPNRCLPCTVVNLGITAVLAVGAGLLFPPAGIAVAVMGVATIALKGYLVPGTPTLTKRYLPDRVLRWFGKAPDAPDFESDMDPESYLLELGVIREGQEDLVLVDDFAARWRAEIEIARTDATERVATLLDLEAPELRSDDPVNVYDDGRRVAQWPSRAALYADLGAIRALEAEGVDFAELNPTEQGQLLSGLRVFAEECPDCGGAMELAEETVESCCRMAEVITYDCLDCEARVLEIEV